MQIEKGFWYFDGFGCAAGRACGL